MNATAILAESSNRGCYYVYFKRGELPAGRVSRRFATIADAMAAFPQITGWREPDGAWDVGVVAIAEVTLDAAA